MHAPFAGTAAAHVGTVTGIVKPLSGGESAAIGLLALLIVMFPVLFALVDHLDTIAHEGMHAIFAVLLGFSVVEFVLNRDGSGHVRHNAGSFGLRVLLVLLVGYLGPSAFGLLGAKLIETGHVIAVLWVAIALLALLLCVISVSFGFVTVPVLGALLLLVLRYSHTGLEEFAAYLLTWLMLLTGARTALYHRHRAADAAILRQNTYLPRSLWALIWIAGTLLAVGVGGKWLVTGT